MHNKGQCFCRLSFSAIEAIDVVHRVNLHTRFALFHIYTIFVIRVCFMPDKSTRVCLLTPQKYKFIVKLQPLWVWRTSGGWPFETRNLKNVKKNIQLSNMKDDNKLASENATCSSAAKNIRLYIAKGLFKMTMAIDPSAIDLLLDMQMKVAELIGEIVPVEINDVLVVATERFLMTDLDLTFDEFTEAEELFYDKLYHRMKQTGLVSGRDEFQQLWDEASKLLQQVDRGIGGPMI